MNPVADFLLLSHLQFAANMSFLFPALNSALIWPLPDVPWQGPDVGYG